MKHVASVVVAAVLVACAPTFEARVQPVMTGPDGHLWIPLRCADPLQCYARAEFFCREGYLVADREGHVESSLSGSSYRGTGVVHGESHYKGMMLIQCKSCEVDRRFRVDESGAFVKDPDRSDIVRLCSGEG